MVWYTKYWWCWITVVSRLFCFNINMEYQGKAFSLIVSDTTLNMVEISLYFTQTQESWRFGICHKYEPNIVFIISICQVGRYLYKTESVQVLELFLGICWRINWLIPPPPSPACSGCCVSVDWCYSMGGGGEVAIL